jgi:hypothetical protein
MFALRAAVERDPAGLGPLVRARWDEFEHALVRDAADIEETAPTADVLTTFMERNVDAYLAQADAITQEIARPGD